MHAYIYVSDHFYKEHVASLRTFQGAGTRQRFQDELDDVKCIADESFELYCFTVNFKHARRYNVNDFPPCLVCWLLVLMS